MSERKVIKVVTGQPAVDGAGVHLIRVLGHETITDFDPFLMLDSFDSENPEDYMKGFPMHPHRGIETITYLISGRMEHEDSLGNKGMIHAGESQWMTAGSGIMHQEMPKPSRHMLGVQIWLNLPREEKMTKPAYHEIPAAKIGVIETPSGFIKVLSSEYKGVRGAEPQHISASVFDVLTRHGEAITIATKPEETVFIFLIEGDAVIGNERIAEKTAVLFGAGDQITVQATATSDCRFLFFSAPPLREPVAWGGPIVMNTEEELRNTFKELQNGSFIKEQGGYLMNLMHTKKKTVGILAGSLRKQSYSRQVALIMAEILADNYETVMVDIGNLAIFNQDFDDEGNVPEEWTDFRKTIRTMDAFLFVTPEYNRSIPPVLKNAIDIGSRPQGQNLWSGKPGAVISVAPGAIGGFGANHHLRQTLACLNVYTLQQPEMYIGNITNIFNEDGTVKSENTKEFLQMFGGAFGLWIEKF